MHLYCPPEIYGKDHPEFYFAHGEDAKIDREDAFGWYGSPHFTVCLNNGITEDGKLDQSMDVSVAKVVIEELKKDIIAHPD